MEPKDLRTLRRPLNVVAMRAPLSSDCLGGTYPKTRQSAVGYRGICLFSSFTRAQRCHGAYPEPGTGIGATNVKSPMANSHEVYGTSAHLRHQNRHISANWRLDLSNRPGESSRRDEVAKWHIARHLANFKARVEIT